MSLTPYLLKSKIPDIFTCWPLWSAVFATLTIAMIFIFARTITLKHMLRKRGAQIPCTTMDAYQLLEPLLYESLDWHFCRTIARPRHAYAKNIGFGFNAEQNIVFFKSDDERSLYSVACAVLLCSEIFECCTERNKFAFRSRFISKLVPMSAKVTFFLMGTTILAACFFGIASAAYMLPIVDMGYCALTLALTVRMILNKRCFRKMAKQVLEAAPMTTTNGVVVISKNDLECIYNCATAFSMHDTYFLE